MDNSDDVHVSDIFTWDESILTEYLGYKTVDDGGGTYHEEDENGRVVSIGMSLPRVPGYDNPIDEIIAALEQKIEEVPSDS